MDRYEAQDEMWDAVAATDDRTADQLDRRQTDLLGSGVCPYCRSARFTDDDGSRTCEGCNATFPSPPTSA